MYFGSQASNLLSLLHLLTNTLPGPSASEVTTLWRYANMFIIIGNIIFQPQFHHSVK